MCAWLGKTGGAFRFSLTFSPFFVKKKGMASAAKKRKKFSVRNKMRAKKTISLSVLKLTLSSQCRHQPLELLIHAGEGEQFMSEIFEGSA